MNTLAVAAPMADRLSSLFFVLVAAAAAIYAMHRWPKAGVIAWFFVIAFVPEWMGISLGGYVPPSVATAMLILAALIPLHIPHLGMPDLLTAAFFAACILPFSFGDLRFSALFTAVAIWGSAFLLGRLLPLKVDLAWITAAFAIVMGIVGVAAMVEFLAALNPFADLFPASNGSYGAWSSIQERGGVLRAEWAFGHSIALGSALALGIPFAIGSRLKTSWRVLLVLAMVGGIAVTFSRAAMLSGALALLLSLYALRTGLSGRVKAGVLIAGAFAVVALQPLVAGVFVDAGSEATNSSAYREALLALVGEIDLVGTTGAATITAGGSSLFGQFDSVDSAVLLLGLNFGWLALGLGLLLFAGAVAAVVRRDAHPAVVAVVAIAPSLLTVALITQYAALFWFVAGLAVYSRSTRSPRVVVSSPSEDGVQVRDPGAVALAGR